MPLHAFDMVKGSPVVVLLNEEALGWIWAASMANREQYDDEMYEAMITERQTAAAAASMPAGEQLQL
jgi:hypothetical protein